MASIRSLFFISRGLALVLLMACAVAAQEPTQPVATSEQQTEQQKAQAAREAQALKLLDETVAEAQALRLPENRLRVQYTAADSLWPRDEARARGLFLEAQGTLAAMMIGLTGNVDRQQLNVATQVRQELINVVAGRDPNLALDIFRATRPPQTAQSVNPLRQTDSEAFMEFNLIARVAASDPKLALQKAEELLAKGEYSVTLRELLARLQTKDKDAAAKLAEDMLKGLRGENLNTNTDARNLAFALLRPGPLAANTPVEQKVSDVVVNGQIVSQTRSQVLSEASYRELLDSVVSTALSVTLQNTTPNARAFGGGRGGGGGVRGGLIDQGELNGRILLAGVNSLLPQIDKYLPARATLVRQKLSASGINFNNQPFFNGPSTTTTGTTMQPNTVDALLNTANQVPPGMQDRVYQQAAMQAANEGNTERARQIANDHLGGDARARVLQAVEQQQIIRAAQQGKIDEARQMLARLQSDSDRVEALLQLVSMIGQSGGEQKASLQLLDEARALVSRRAENYQQMSAQLHVAQAYAPVDPTRGFEVLEPGISQINELLGAAALLNGFEGRFFRDGELPLRGETSLGGIINEYAQALAVLARVDFDDAQAAADKFQRLEPRVIAKLAIARGILGGTTNTTLAPNTFNRRARGARFVN